MDHWTITGEQRPAPPSEDLHGKGVLTLVWYGSEFQVELDGQDFMLTEWLCAYEHNRVEISLKVVNPEQSTSGGSHHG